MKWVVVAWLSVGAESQTEVAPIDLFASPGCQRCCGMGECSQAYQGMHQGMCCSSMNNPTCCPIQFNGQPYHCQATGGGNFGCAPGVGGYNPGGYNPGGYNPGGYNPGGYNPYQPHYQPPAPPPYYPPAPPPAPYNPEAPAPYVGGGQLATPEAAACPMAMNLGSVGSCMIFGCSASRGPTHCTLGSCYCNNGFCRYPASTFHLTSRYCVQRVPQSTCHVSRVCYKAGLTTTFCEKGLCMCKWGYRLDVNGKCVSAGTTLAALGNNTEPEDIEFVRMQEIAVAWNVAMFACWVAGFFVVFSAAAAFLYVKLHRNEEQDNVNAYTEFLASEE